jgi:DNA repair protein RadC
VAGRHAADALLHCYSGLGELANASFDELREVPGVGPSKAAAIRSSFLLAQRLSRECYGEGSLLDSPERTADFLREEFRVEIVERMYVLLVNTRRRLISAHAVSQGTLDTLLVHPREVFHPAVIKRAAAVILAHNHPSGDANPSEADIRVTRDLIRAGQILKIEVLDHIIMGKRTPERPKDFVSLREMGFFYS